MSALPARAAEDSFEMARDEFERLVGYLRSGGARDLSHADLERALTERGREVLRQLYQAHLDSRGAGEAVGPVTGADGVVREQKRLHERGLHTVFGEVQVRRFGYGAEGAASLHPLDAELNLPVESYSLELRRKAADQAAQVSFDATMQYLARETGTEVGKRQVEELVQRAAEDFDTFYESRTRDPDTPKGPILVVSVDGKGVVMRRQDLREATRKAAEKRRHKLDKRLSKGEKRNAKRMATVAAVYTVPPVVREPEDIVRVLAPRDEREKDPRPRPEGKRVWASLVKEPEQVIEDVFAEAKRRDPEGVKTWVALVDGNDPQLRILKRLAKKWGIRLTIVLDIIHVTEYLSRASTTFHDEANPEREAWVTKRLLAVLHGGASHVAAGIRRSATLRSLGTEMRQPADDCADYLLTYAPYLRYDTYLAAGLPIATGVIEGACRHLVKDRMDITGARWSLQGAEAVLRLRALRSSGDFDAYWSFHEAQEFRRNHAANYAAGRVVPVQGRKPNLRRLK